MGTPPTSVIVTIPICVVGPRISQPGTDVIQLPMQLEVDEGGLVIVAFRRAMVVWDN